MKKINWKTQIAKHIEKIIRKPLFQEWHITNIYNQWFNYKY